MFGWGQIHEFSLSKVATDPKGVIKAVEGPRAVSLINDMTTKVREVGVSTEHLLYTETLSALFYVILNLMEWVSFQFYR